MRFSRDASATASTARLPSSVTRTQMSHGQSLVELALILPLLVLIVAIAGDFGRAMTAHIAIGGAAREAAAYGMQSSSVADDQDGMRAAALADSPTIWGTAPEVSFPPCIDAMTGPNGTPYQCVAVTVSYQFRPIMSIGPIPDSVPMQRTVEMRVIN